MFLIYFLFPSLQETTQRLQQILTDIKEDKDTDAANTMRLCEYNLKQSASIINRVLHNQYISNDESDTLAEESKTTRRNSQYKTSAIYMIYYIIYTIYYNKPPENINFILSDKESNNINYKVSEGQRTGPIQHYNTFKNYTYTYQMTCLVDKNMKHLINFGIDEYFKHCGVHIAITLSIKRLEKKSLAKRKIRNSVQLYNCNKKKQKNDVDLLLQKNNDLEIEDDEELTTLNIKGLNNKRKHYNESSSSYNKRKRVDEFSPATTTVNSEDDEAEEELFLDEFYCEDDNEIIDYDNPEINNLVAPFAGKTIPELREASRRPSVLYKFYQAWLMECDWVVLFEVLAERIRAGECPPAQLRRLIQYTICVLCKHITVPVQRGLFIEKLVQLIKNDLHLAIVLELGRRAADYKYSRFEVPSIPNSSISDETHAYDLKLFQQYARFTDDMYIHVTAYPITLIDASYQHTIGGYSHSIKILKYIHVGHHYLFDVIQITGIDDELLHRMSWLERLNLVSNRNNFLPGDPEYRIIRLQKITLREIQFENISSGPTVYAYIRTKGLGIGTLFQRLRVPTKDETNSRISRPRITVRGGNTRRFTRVTLADLIKPMVTEKDIEVEHDVKASSNNITTNTLNNLFYNNPNNNNFNNQNNNIGLLGAQLIGQQVLLAIQQQQQQQQQLTSNSLIDSYLNPYINSSHINQNLYFGQPPYRSQHSPSPPPRVRTPSPPPPEEGFFTKINEHINSDYSENTIFNSEEDDVFKNLI
ncbi:HgNV_030 [Dikerogammarus haemobaphes nudivirus]|nr:HgNV_030 [Dikerogammarus haemobaphes nudivirus]